MGEATKRKREGDEGEAKGEEATTKKKKRRGGRSKGVKAKRRAKIAEKFKKRDGPADV